AIAQCVRRVRGFGERANEYHVDVFGQLRQQIFKARVTNEGNLVALLLAPDPNDLGHNARQAGVHYPCVKSPSGTPGNNVDDANPQPLHEPCSPPAWCFPMGDPVLAGTCRCGGATACQLDFLSWPLVYTSKKPVSRGGPPHSPASTVRFSPCRGPMWRRPALLGGADPLV